MPHTLGFLGQELRMLGLSWLVALGVRASPPGGQMGWRGRGPVSC